MEIRIGVQQAPREVVLESNESADSVKALIDTAITSGTSLTLTDEKGRTVVVPGDKIAYVEIGVQAVGRVGFTALS